MSLTADLSSIELFRSLGDKGLARVARIARHRSFAQRECIFDVGQPVTHVYLLLEGLVVLRLPGANRD